MLPRGWYIIATAAVIFPILSTSSGFLTQHALINPPSKLGVSAKRHWKSQFFVIGRITEIASFLQGSSDDHRIEKLWSYVHSLQRSRKTGDLKAAKSLVAFLSHNPVLHPSGEDLHQQVVERAMIQGFRSAGEKGDYKLVMSLLEASILYANNHPILTPRIFGEALEALSQTRSNASKMKHVWSLVAAGDATFLQSPLTAFELNVMLKVLANRGKVRACIDLFERHTKFAASVSVTRIQPDAYTASALFTILTDSIAPDQILSEPMVLQPREGASMLQSSLIKLTSSPCWQWNAAVELLSELGKEQDWNNHVFSSLLKLQDRAQETFVRHRNGPDIALKVLEAMIAHGIIPDVVTCTLAIKAMGDSSHHSSWKIALKLLGQMKTDDKWPIPNVYSYSAAIVACARCHQYHVALDLLEEMRNGAVTQSTTFTPPQPNTWVYNAALLSIGPESHLHRIEDSVYQYRMTNKDVRARRELALNILKQMEEDFQDRGMQTAPDTVTYNTILAITATDALGDEGHSMDDLVSDLLDQMKERGVLRDAITYRNAIFAASDGIRVLRMLVAALKDSSSIVSSSKASELSNGGKPLDGKATDGLTFIFNSALSTLASRRDFMHFSKAFSKMQESRVKANDETTTHLISALVYSRHTSAVSLLFSALTDDDETAESARQLFAESIGLEISRETLPAIDEIHYSSAIRVCLSEGQIEEANQILSLMREKNMQPTKECLGRFSLAYARAAIKAASEGSRQEKHRSSSSGKEFWTALSRDRATSAYRIALSLQDAPTKIMCDVARACALAGMWEEARTILRSIHHEVSSVDNNSVSNRRGEISFLPKLHRTFLWQCAKRGNITAALWYVDDIQRLSRKMRLLQSTNETSPVTEVELLDEHVDFFAGLREARIIAPASGLNIGMMEDDWALLLKAASKSGHWRVCISTLQFLRPYLQKLHPNSVPESDTKVFQERYEKLAPSLTFVARCLEKRSQYGWTVRVIEDWIEWSGRRPPTESVLAAIRILSARGRGDEVSNLLARCLLVEANALLNEKYAQILHIGAITALHRNGLYDDADEVFMTAISQGYLSLALERRDNELVLDLHGLNVALAHSAVRLAMRQHPLIAEQKCEASLIIVTGQGRNSAFRMRPVLRPEIQRMLLEEFYPPLNSMSLPGNMGALAVNSQDLAAWQSHQQEQKGARFLAIAAALKNLSSLDRIRDRIAVSLSKRTNDSANDSGND